MIVCVSFGVQNVLYIFGHAIHCAFMHASYVLCVFSFSCLSCV